jgi:cell division transport system permease protein
MNALRYSMEEAWASLKRRRRASLTAVVTIAAAMAIPGGFTIGMRNVNRIMAGWEQSAELSVFLRQDATPQQIAAIEQALDASGVVARRTFISRTDALRRFRSDFPDLGAAAASLDENPLPASIEARLDAGRSAREGVDRLVGRLNGQPGVADVRADRTWLMRLLAFMRMVRALAVTTALLLAIAAAFTVANVVRLAAVARTQEIEIMQLVGAPAVYVRGPFVAEGVIQGGAGALLAVILLGFGVFGLQLRYASVLTETIGLSSVMFISPSLAVGLIAGGMAIGCAGGYVAARGVRTT